MFLRGQTRLEGPPNPAESARGISLETHGISLSTSKVEGADRRPRFQAGGLPQPCAGGLETSMSYEMFAYEAVVRPNGLELREAKVWAG